jgi:hypothetical protein
MFSHNMSQQLPEARPQLPDAAPSRPHLQNPTISDSMFHLSPFLILNQHIISPPALQAFNPAGMCALSMLVLMLVLTLL